MNPDDYVTFDKHVPTLRFDLRDADCEVGDRYASEIASGTAIAEAEFGPEIWAEHGANIIDNGKGRLYLTHVCGMAYDPLAVFLDGMDAFVSYDIEQRERCAFRFAPLYGRTEAETIHIPEAHLHLVAALRDRLTNPLDTTAFDAFEGKADADREDEEGAEPRVRHRFSEFVAYLPGHSYIYKPTRSPWPGGSIDAILPMVKIGVDKNGRAVKIRAGQWLDQNQAVEQMTWAPGEPMLIKDRLIMNGGWFPRPGDTVFNLYRPPIVEPGDASKAGRWIDHIRRIYPESVDHLIKWFASRIQHPETKINHALVLGGNQGIGKDTILEPVKYAIAPWNFSEASPTQILGRFNGFLKSVVLRVSEARDLGDSDRYAFYEHMKPIIAAPPDVLRVDEKHLREHDVFNVVGVVITTNNKSNGIYLPADDRRHYVAWSDIERTAFDKDYFDSLYEWFGSGGLQHVAAYLRTLDLTGFNPKAPPPQTAAFWEIVDASRVSEDAELADLLDKLGNPDAVTLKRLVDNASEEFAGWLNDRKNRRQIPHRMEQCRYVAVRNPTAGSGLWQIRGARQVVYAKKDLSINERHRAAQNLV